MPLLRGALIEYGTDLIGPIPNVVIFQFNPESLSRSLQIPPRPTGATQRETTQAGEKTFEKISQSALSGLDTATLPVIIEINDSLVHRIDLSALPGTNVEGGTALRLAQSLTIRAASGHRPIVLLAHPLAFRPVAAAAATRRHRRSDSKGCI